MGWRIPSLFKSSNVLSHQLSHLTTVTQIHLAKATKPPQLLKAPFKLAVHTANDYANGKAADMAS